MISHPLSMNQDKRFNFCLAYHHANNKRELFFSPILILSSKFYLKTSLLENNQNQVKSIKKKTNLRLSIRKPK